MLNKLNFFIFGQSHICHICVHVHIFLLFNTHFYNKQNQYLHLHNVCVNNDWTVWKSENTLHVRNWRNSLSENGFKERIKLDFSHIVSSSRSKWNTHSFLLVSSLWLLYSHRFAVAVFSPKQMSRCVAVMGRHILVIVAFFAQRSIEKRANPV